MNAAVAQDKIACREHDKAVLREQLDTLADQMAALDARKAKRPRHSSRSATGTQNWRLLRRTGSSL